MAVAIAMSEPSILWNRLSASPILFNVIYSRIIYARNALTANRTSRIGVEQLLLQRTGKTARLQGLILKNRIKTVFVIPRTGTECETSGPTCCLTPGEIVSNNWERILKTTLR